ncbi:MmcQ/YjbR family DNA-binding protein [Paenibacillus elgii]|uniref:MmcQ/YjbR family DNA-binding protein n=1 Tax=Paenibacillus elgii TaxID=189691 RepID=UPI000AD63149|nr:MmcQ/YjbR family DNA-binding protein [Paenibacillus elgii]
MIDHARLTEYGLKKPGTSLKYPFDPDLPVLFVGDKMFALLGTHQDIPSVNLKCDPDNVWLVRQTYPTAVLPGYHMNKRHWNTVVLNGEVPDTEVLDMLEESYQLVYRKLTRAVKEAISGG